MCGDPAVYTAMLLHGGHRDWLRLAREKAASLVMGMHVSVMGEMNTTGDDLGH